MGTVVRTGSRALVGVACLLLAFSATDTGKTHPQGLQRWELLGWWEDFEEGARVG